MKTAIKTLVFSAFAVISVAAAGNGGVNGNKLQCFSGTEDPAYVDPVTGDVYVFGGTCEIVPGGCAKLDTTSPDTDPTLADGELPGGNYAGVYISPGLPAKPIGDINKLSFSYTVDEGEPGVSGGSPRFSIPIDENGDGTTESYAFIDAANCGQIGATSGTVGLSCPVYYNNVGYATWADFAAANPTYRFAKDALAFVIVDQPFKGTICDVQLGKASAKSK